MNEDGECASCPEGTKCDSAGNELSSLWVEAGYFRGAVESTTVYACTFGEVACPGGNTTGNKLCSEGYEGPLCDR